MGTFNTYDSTYSYTNISGTMFTFEKMIGKFGEREFIRIGVSKSFGKTYHDFEIKAKVLAQDSSEFNMYVMESPFGARTLLRFNDEEFMVFYVFDENYGESGLWMYYYKGMFFTPIKEENEQQKQKKKSKKDSSK